MSDRLHKMGGNALLLWGRTLAAMGATILTTRFALQALGTDAYGTFVAAAGLPLMLTFMTGAMTVVTQRMLAVKSFATARDEQAEFNAGMVPHILIALTILLLGETLGLWMVERLLTIPPELFDSAIGAFRIMVVAMSLGAVFIPFEAFMQLRERFGMFAALAIAQALAATAGSYWLLDYDGDRLLAYAVIQAVSMTGTSLLGALIVAALYPQARISLKLLLGARNLGERWSMFGGTAVGSFSFMARSQGILILANVVFGPAASSAVGIANQLQGVMRQLATAFSSAVAPRAYAIYATGDRARMVELTLFACKYASLTITLLGVPLVMEMPHILSLWLVSPPPATGVAAMMLIAALLLDHLSSSTGIAQNAIGKIVFYKVSCSVITLAALPLAYWIGMSGGALPLLLVPVVATNAVELGWRLYLLNGRSPGAIASWARLTLGSLAPILMCQIGAAMLVTAMMQPSLLRIIVTAAASTAAILPPLFILGLAPAERAEAAKLLSRLGTLRKKQCI